MNEWTLEKTEGFRMSSLLLHFDGDITHDHTVSLRTLGKALTHLQAAVNRAHLDLRYGEVWKGARLQKEDYEATELWSRPPQEGGYIIDFINDSPQIRKTLTRMINAITPTVERSQKKAIVTAGSLAQQSDIAKQRIDSGIIQPEQLADYMPYANQRPYGDRAINKEIDLLISVVRTPNAGQSTIEIVIGGDQSSTFKFNRQESEDFHSYVSTRHLGEPFIISANLRELDAKNKSGRIMNLATGREIKMTFTDDSFGQIKPFLGSPDVMSFIGCPIYEGGTFDIHGGDIFFLRLV